MSNDDLNALAAEYVLGTLDYEERKGATALLEVDATFRGIVRIWERRFGELHLMVESVEPDPQLWARIKPKVPGVEQVALAIPSSHTEESPAEAAAAAPAAEAAAATLAPEGAAAEPKAEATSAEPTTAPIGGETPPAEAKPVAVAEAELKLAELAALLPVTAEPGGVAPTEQAPENGLHTHAPDLVPRGFVPPPPMITRGTPAVVAAPVRKTGRGWMAATLAMSLVAVVLAGLIGAWRFFPERLPAQLRAYTVLNLSAPPPAQKARPKLAPFDE